MEWGCSICALNPSQSATIRRYPEEIYFQFSIKSGAIVRFVVEDVYHPPVVLNYGKPSSYMINVFEIICCLLPQNPGRELDGVTLNVGRYPITFYVVRYTITLNMRW